MKCHKRGKRNGKQVYRCTTCHKYQRETYTNQSYKNYHKTQLINLNNEGVGISSISRLLNIPKSSVCRLLKTISDQLETPTYQETHQEYEIDELRACAGKKNQECWVCYAINRKTKSVVHVTVGRRTKENIRQVVQKILLLSPSKIYTDGLNVYPSLIPKRIHSRTKRQTNHIERKNLTLRTHIKRLAHKTMCYSKSADMLLSSLKIYFWSEVKNHTIMHQSNKTTCYLSGN